MIIIRQVTNLQMSEEQLKAFLEKVKADTSLQEKLQGVTDADAIVAIAKEAGFCISADELKKAVSDVSELDEEQLEKVSGGGNNRHLEKADMLMEKAMNWFG